MSRAGQYRYQVDYRQCELRFFRHGVKPNKSTFFAIGFNIWHIEIKIN